VPDTIPVSFVKWNRALMGKVHDREKEHENKKLRLGGGQLLGAETWRAVCVTAATAPTYGV
jgi:hypothetical protein